MVKPQAHILCIIPLAYQDGRDKYAGFLRYVAETACKWEVQLERDPPSAMRLQQLSKKTFDGIVMDGDFDLTAFLAQSPAQACVAMDIANRKLLPRHRTRIAFVETDSTELGQRAADYFLARSGTVNFAFVGYEAIDWSLKRQTAYRSRLAMSKRSPLEHVLPYRGDLTATAQRNLIKFIKGLPRPVGIFAACDNLARLIIQIAEGAGIAVPNEIAVLGTDNEDIICTHSRPTISSLQPNFTTIGYESAHQLDQMLTTGKCAAGKCRISGVRLVERESTAQSYSGAFLVARAQEMIRNWPSSQLHVDDIARSLGVSRRLLDLRFREIAGESVLDFIRRERIDRAKKFLIETQMPIGMICEACNFRSTNQFKRIFHAVTGLSMTAWRRTRANDI